MCGLMCFSKETHRPMKNIQTQIRHLLTFLAGFGGILFTWNLVDPGSVEAINKAGADLIVPLTAFIGVVFVGLARAAMIWLGNRFPFFSKLSVSNGNVGTRPSGGHGNLPLGLLLFCGLGFLFLPSCSGEYPITGQISYRDPASGAKGGLVFEPGKAPRASVRVPVYDPNTGELIGVGELSGPLARRIEASK